jgi:Argininosuccinate lyase
LIASKEADAIQAALKELSTQVADGSFAPIDNDEDVHSALERGLTEKLGLVGGALRAGRSRNDQVTTDLAPFLDRSHAGDRSTYYQSTKCNP